MEKNKIREYTLKIDPRLKLAILIISSSFLVLNNDQAVISRILLFLVVLLLLSFKSIKKFIYLGFFSSFSLLIVNQLFLKIDGDNFIIMILRLLSFISLFLWFYEDLSPENLSKTLMWYRIPYKQAIYISISFRYIFYFRDETETISNALILRGVALDSNFISRLTSFHLVILPLLSRTSFKSQIFSEALFSKNWSPYGKKTFLEPLLFKYLIDIPFLIIWILIIII